MQIKASSLDRESSEERVFRFNLLYALRRRVSAFLNRFSAKLTLCLAFAALFNFACEANPSMVANLDSPTPSATQTENNLTSLEREIRDMKTVDFQFIYVFKRKDGGVFDAEDKQYLRANRPAEANRFILTDDEKAIVAGSQFRFSPENLEMLQKRFVMEDYSKPVAPKQPENNTNQPQNR